jgi:tripartite ATP-independent transporter DctM subunit
MLMGHVHLATRRAGWDGPRDRAEDEPGPGRALLGALPAIGLPVHIIAGIRLGAFTPSEAGGLAVADTLVFVTVYREASWSDLLAALRGTVATTSAILLVIAASAPLTRVPTFMRVPKAVGEAMPAATDHPTAMLALVSAVLLLAGMIVEGTALILVLAPMFTPVAQRIGIDPIRFGIVFVFMIHLGGITPPVGTVMVTTCAATGVAVAQFARAVAPFLATFLATAALLVAVPGVSTLLGGL